MTFKESEEPSRAKDEMFVTNKEKTVRLRDEKNLKVGRLKLCF